MLNILAQTDRDQALSEGYWGIVLILVIGLIAILLMVALFIGRRWKRRQLDAIEKDKADRRAMRSTERIDAWKAGSDRYVDHDKLPDEVPYDTEPDEQDDPADSSGSDTFDKEDAPQAGWDEPGRDEQEDPYGLFDDVPFQESEDEDDSEDDEDWDDEGEEDVDEDEKKDGP